MEEAEGEWDYSRVKISCLPICGSPVFAFYTGL